MNEQGVQNEVNGSTSTRKMEAKAERNFNACAKYVCTGCAATRPRPLIGSPVCRPITPR